MSVFDLTHGQDRSRVPDALMAAMDRVELALIQECSALAAIGDTRGATRSRVARRSGESYADTGTLLLWLVADGFAVRVGEGRSVRYRPVPR